MARDVFHQQVRNALEKDEWSITDDLLYVRSIRYANKQLYKIHLILSITTQQSCFYY